MTVSELIAKLSEYDGSLSVYGYGEQGELVDSTCVCDFTISEYEGEIERELSAVFVG